MNIKSLCHYRPEFWRKKCHISGPVTCRGIIFYFSVYMGQWVEAKVMEVKNENVEKFY